MKTPTVVTQYAEVLESIKARIQQARITAAQSVNRELVLVYWDIGRVIAEKQRDAAWGDSVVERLAADLRAAIPNLRGFSTANIWRVRQLYHTFTSREFLAQAARELGAIPKLPALVRQTLEISQD